MNKIIAIAAAMVAGVSMAQGIESANIVGYMENATINGSKGAGSMFVPVAGSAVDLQDIKVVGYEGEFGDDINIAKLDRLGRTVVQYFWADLPDDGIYGWLDADEEVAEGVSFNPGEGVWVFSSNPDLSLQFAGQVMTKDLQVGLINGSMLVVNPTPIAINIQDISVAGYEGEFGDDLNMAKLDRLGRTVVQYFWADLPDDGIYGWLDADEEVAEDVTIEAGDAVWVFSSNEDLSLVIPGVTL